MADVITNLCRDFNWIHVSKADLGVQQAISNLTTHDWFCLNIVKQGSEIYFYGS